MSWPAKACGRRGIAARRAAAVLIAASADWHALTATADALRNLRRVRLRSPGSLGPGRLVPCEGWPEISRFAVPLSGGCAES